MYEIGVFTVVGEHEDIPPMGIRLVPHSHPAAYPWWSETTRTVLEALPDLVAPGMRVLDFGCGASCILSLAAARLGADVTALEIHPALRAIARTQIEANGLAALLPDDDDGRDYDVVLANLGDAVLVGTVSRRAPHGIGTGPDGDLVRW